MSASLIPTPVMQFFDSNGDPLSGGKVYTYAAGTSTPLATYTDQGGATPNANPVILDSRGEAAIWFGTSSTSSYKIVLKTSADVLIWTADNVTGSLATFAGSSGSSLVGFLQAGSGAVARTVQAKERDIISVKDFGALGDGTTDDGPAFNAALLAAKTAGIPIVFAPRPSATYKLSTAIVDQDNVSLMVNPKDLSGAQYPSLGTQLATTQGATYPYYKISLGLNQTVADGNGSLTNPYRYWTVYGGVTVPAGATVTAGDVNQDHVGVTGYATSAAVNSRIWASQGVVQVSQSAANQTQLGAAYASELDINNNSGLDPTLPGGAELVGQQVATGGTNRVLAARKITRSGITAQFIVGDLYANGALYHSAAYFYDVGPLTAFYYFSDGITNSVPALHTKNLQDAVYMRNAASTDHCGRVTSTATQMKLVGGPSGGIIPNHADAAVNANWTDNGTFIFRQMGQTIQTVATAGTVTGLAVTGGGIINLSAASQLSNIAAPDSNGQIITIWTTRAGGCTFKNAVPGSALQMLLAGSADFVAVQYSTLTLFSDGGSWVEIGRSAR